MVSTLQNEFGSDDADVDAVDVGGPDHPTSRNLHSCCAKAGNCLQGTHTDRRQKASTYRRKRTVPAEDKIHKLAQEARNSFQALDFTVTKLQERYPDVAVSRDKALGVSLDFRTVDLWHTHDGREPIRTFEQLGPGDNARENSFVLPTNDNDKITAVAIDRATESDTATIVLGTNYGYIFSIENVEVNSRASVNELVEGNRDKPKISSIATVVNGTTFTVAYTTRKTLRVLLLRHVEGTDGRQQRSYEVGLDKFEINTQRPGETRLEGAALSGDGKHVAAALRISEGDEVLLWDLEKDDKGEHIKRVEFSQPLTRTESIALNRDGSQLVAAGKVYPGDTARDTHEPSRDQISVVFFSKGERAERVFEQSLQRPRVDVTGDGAHVTMMAGRNTNTREVQSQPNLDGHLNAEDGSEDEQDSDSDDAPNSHQKMMGRRTIRNRTPTPSRTRNSTASSR